MSQRLFITGTDTGVGKTYVSCGLLTALNARGFKTIALKPVASGCELTGQYYCNADALLLQQHASIHLPYAAINPYNLHLPIAPHLAAQAQGISLNAADVIRRCEMALAQPADYALIEGVGGWEVPLNSKETMAAVAMGLKAKVILVVGMRLGCLNHAILTYQAIQNSACEIVGWIANSLAEDMPYLVENIASLQERLTAPLLGYIPYQANVAEQVNVASLCFERGVAGRASVQCVANLQHQVT